MADGICNECGRIHQLRTQGRHLVATIHFEITTICSDQTRGSKKVLRRTNYRGIANVKSITWQLHSQKCYHVYSHDVPVPKKWNYHILPYNITVYYHILPYIHPLKWISRPGPCLVPGTKLATSLGKSQQLCGIGRPPKSTNASEIPGLGWESIKHGIVNRRSWRFNEIYGYDFFMGMCWGWGKEKITNMKIWDILGL